MQLAHFRYTCTLLSSIRIELFKHNNDNKTKKKNKNSSQFCYLLVSYMYLSAVISARWGSSYLCRCSRITGKPLQRLKLTFTWRYTGKCSMHNVFNGRAILILWQHVHVCIKRPSGMLLGREAIKEVVISAPTLLMYLYIGKVP